mmetsp:Transcript_4637/g.12448  ORF Transcript_4637/g.12448 Transcript_4637/m.12448 type:complete len:297 (+) Transcript_4637:2771-3661(+)
MFPADERDLHHVVDSPEVSREEEVRVPRQRHPHASTTASHVLSLEALLIHGLQPLLRGVYLLVVNLARLQRVQPSGRPLSQLLYGGRQGHVSVPLVNQGPIVQKEAAEQEAVPVAVVRHGQRVRPQHQDRPHLDVDGKGLSLVLVGLELKRSGVGSYGNDAHDRPLHELEQPLGGRGLGQRRGLAVWVLREVQDGGGPLLGLEAEIREERSGAGRDVRHGLVEGVQALAVAQGRSAVVCQLKLGYLGRALLAKEAVHNLHGRPPQPALPSHVHALLQRLGEQRAVDAGIDGAEGLA